MIPATSQKPQAVINAVNEFYRNHNANIHRSIHKLGEEATRLYEESHKKVSDSINAGFEEVISGIFFAQQKRTRFGPAVGGAFATLME